MATTKDTRKSGEVIKIKDYKKRAKCVRRNRRIVLFILLLACLVCFALFAPFFKVSGIACSGNQKLSAEQIISASQISMGYNIYRTSLSKATENIGQLPYIQSVQAKRKFPNKIEISVVECTVAGYFAYGDGYCYIDATGKVLEQTGAAPGAPAVLIENIDATECVPGERIVCADQQKFDCLLATLNEIVHNDLSGTVTKIDLAQTDNLIVTFGEAFEVTVGTSDRLDYKLGFLAKQAYHNLGEGAEGFLDVSSGEKAFYREEKRELPNEGDSETDGKAEEEEADGQKDDKSTRTDEKADDAEQTGTKTKSSDKKEDKSTDRKSADDDNKDTKSESDKKTDQKQSKDDELSEGVEEA